MITHFITILTLLTIFSSLSRSQEADLYLSPNTTVIYKAIGDGVVLGCTARMTRNPQMSWYAPDGSEVWEEVQTYRISKEQQDNTLKLIIANIQDNDQGDWTCQGIVEGRTLKRTISLRIFQKISFENFVQFQKPIAGSTATIRCVVRGSPTPIVTWMKGEKEPGKQSSMINSGGRYTIIQDGLLIENITREDSGFYKCIAQQLNSAITEYASKVIEVDVHGMFSLLICLPLA